MDDVNGVWIYFTVDAIIYVLVCQENIKPLSVYG